MFMNQRFFKNPLDAFKTEAYEAMQKASELDKADGKQDGVISRSIWNEFAEEHGCSKRLFNIKVEDAVQKIKEANSKSIMKPQDAPEVDTGSD